MSSSARLKDTLNGRGRRLESWKAIARYLDRDVRSVQRWERERGLPIHRIPGQKGSVFAYESELENWLHSRRDEEPSARITGSSAVALERRAARRPWLAGAGLLVIVLAVLVGIFLPRGSGRSLPPQTPTPKTLAVLPLVNLSGDRSQDYFADGFTEELTTDLSQLRALRVISRTSTMLYKDSKKPLPEIGRKLHARYILEGSVVRDGERVRVIAQLIDAADDQHISARTYNADIKDLLAVQDRISRAIADDVRLDLSPEEKERLTSAPMVDPEAHELYLRASYAYAAQTPQSIRLSLDLYRAAARQDSRFARAYLGMALAEFALLQITAQDPEDTFRRVKQDAARALQLDPRLGDARGLLASIIYNHDWNWPEAERQFRLALAQGAGAPTEQRFGAALTSRGLFSEGKGHLQAAIELDPLGRSPRVNWLLALLNERKYAQAQEEAGRLLASAPNFLAGHVIRGMAAALQRDCKTAGAEAAWIGQRFPSALAKIMASFASACCGDKAEARRSLDSIGASKAASFASPYQLALGYAAIGDRDAALRYLSRSADVREPQVLFIRVEPILAALHSDPRFIALEERLHLLP